MTERSNPTTPRSRRSDPTPLDTVLTLLGDRHRRRLITDLVDADHRTVSEFVYPDARGDPRTQEITLLHNHLPKLQEAGVIEWDSDGGVVRRGPRFGAVEAVVGLLRSHRDALPADWP